MFQDLIDNLSNNQFLSNAFFLIQSKETCIKRNGDSYYRFLLCDGQKTIKAVMWDNLSLVTDHIQAGIVIKVQGTVNTYQNELQLTLVRVRAAREDEASVSDFLPRTDQDQSDMMQSVDDIIETIASPFLKELLSSFFHDETIREIFQAAPAAKKLHHNMVGGLLEHTLSVTSICESLCSLYPSLNREILLSAALLHDMGKIVELHPLTFDYTDQGRLFGHLFIGAEMINDHAAGLEVQDEQLKLELLHAILAHHGSQEWGSPIVPMTLEAITLHYADNLDAKIVGFENWINENPDRERQGWSRYWPIMQRNIYRRPDADTPFSSDETRDGVTSPENDQTL